MKGIYLIVSIALIFGIKNLSAQENDAMFFNSAEKLLQTDGKLKIGGYGEVHYNQELAEDKIYNGKLDVHRMVMLFGYQFNKRAQFITELEFEHVKEVYVEQAFFQYEINKYINLRAGLLLIPMGLTNEYHEPTTFNGVERPMIDKYISPTTWREAGFGFAGNINKANLKYQAYLINGLKSYDGSGLFTASSPFRSGRQKAAESFISSPNFTTKIEFYGLPNLNIGLSGFFGKSQSTLYDGIDKNDNNAIMTADSSVVGISMIGLDARYNLKGIQLKAQYYYASIANTNQYNHFTSNELANTVGGFYVEAAYNVFKSIDKFESKLTPFVRYQTYDTQQSVDSYITKDDANNKEIITTGLSWAPTNGSILKADMQFVKSKADTKYSKVLNIGLGVMF